MNTLQSKEFETRTLNGWPALAGMFLGGVALGYAVYWIFRGDKPSAWAFVLWCLLALFWFILWFGFFVLQPNIAVVLTLFGKYSGTVRTNGFHWANPFFNKKKTSLRAHNLNGEKIKVNDARGSPIEISAVLVWRVTDAARAVFDVEDFSSFVTIQSEAALRHLAMGYPYDTFEGDTLSLRGSVGEVSAALQKEVQERVARAGVLIEEARINHLAYAPEIAGAMLQRQQAEAVVAARQRLVDGAVGMVEIALQRLQNQHTVELDEDRKAAMVSNLLVVLCGDRGVHPVINTGTLYS